MMAKASAERSDRPLTGKRIVITRPEDDAHRLASRLQQLGAEPIVLPVIRIEFTDPPELAQALLRVKEYDWIIFTSRHGVRAVFRLTSDIRGPSIAAIGPATAAALSEKGIVPDLMPTVFVAEAIVEALGDVQGRNILLPRADIARPTLAHSLVQRGAVVRNIAAYRTQSVLGHRPNLDGVDAITFTSSSTVRGFLESGPVPSGAKVVCIGPITAKTARDHSLSVAATAKEYTADGLVDALISALT